PGGRACVCGNQGCLERYISDMAMIERFAELTGEQISIDQFIAKLKAHDPSALALYREFIFYLGLTINNISQVLNPHAIIINSKIVENMPDCLQEIKTNLMSKLMSLSILSTSTYRSKTNVLGLTHVLIKEFLDIDNYNVSS
ncbi:MAG: ROK family protein, partial [Candidatus Izemoplasmatales bacterium]